MTKINNHVSKAECNVKEDDRYMKMYPNEVSHIMYPYNSSIVCNVCGSMFHSQDQLMSHVEHSPKCYENQICNSCKENGVTDAKMCKHFAPDMARVVIVDASQVMNYDQAVQTEANQNDFNSMNTNYSIPAPVMKRFPRQDNGKFDSRGSHPVSNINSKRRDEEKTICPLPPPPQNDPLKPLPYRIDFLLNSGVIKHARMNTNGKPSNSLYFEKKRPRKPRTHFTDLQIEDLEKVFEDKKYLSATERLIIANDLNLQEEQVKNWFQNRRSRWRKEGKESEVPSIVQQSLQTLNKLKIYHQNPDSDNPQEICVMGDHTEQDQSSQEITFTQEEAIIFEQGSKPIHSLQT